MKPESSAHIVAMGNLDFLDSHWENGTETSYCQRNDNVDAKYETFHRADDFVHNTIAVGCCTATGSTGSRPDCDAEASTYDEALALCTSHGLRLCTKDEVLNRNTQGTGCSYNHAYLWTSDSCTAAPTSEPTTEPTSEPTAIPSAAPTDEDVIDVLYRLEDKVTALEHNLGERIKAVEMAVNKCFVSSAEAQSGNLDVDPSGNTMTDLVGDGLWSGYSFSTQDVAIIALLVLNVILVIGLITVCAMGRGGRRVGKVKYAPVMVAGDSEMEDMRR